MGCAFSQTRRAAIVMIVGLAAMAVGLVVGVTVAIKRNRQWRR